MSRETTQPRSRRTVVWIGVTSIGVLAALAWAGWDALVERCHRWRYAMARSRLPSGPRQR